MAENLKRISDEEFMANYDRHNKEDSRSEKYIKGKEPGSIKIGYWIFLAIVFIAVYYLSSEFIFIPQ